MAKGFFLRVGDKTSCGGEILTGDQTFLWYGVPGARDGDAVSCGKHAGRYQICGGVQDMWDEGSMLAGTLDSVSSCPCRATFINTIFDCYEKEAAVAANTFSTVIPPVTSMQSDHSPEAQTEPVQHAQSVKKKREITLTLGIFFDGTGNNAINTDAMLQTCSSQHFNISAVDALSVLTKCGKEKMGFSGLGAISYTGYYSNVYWLSTLYKNDIPIETGTAQQAVYIEGVGTQAGKKDSMIGQAFGISDTGVIAKTDDAVARIAQSLKLLLGTLDNTLGKGNFSIKSLQFDIFGFSRGAAAARHFANRIFLKDSAVITAINAGMQDIPYLGEPTGKTRFIGIFDTVAAIARPLNGLNPNSADSGDVNLPLRPGVAEKVFHITAQHECRFNFALNSVYPAWPELALPGVHSDIGGGYLPQVKEDLYLTRPQVETVLLSVADDQTDVYRQATEQLEVLDRFPAIMPILNNSEVSAEAWHDDRVAQDRYGNFQKFTFAALTLRDRLVKNDWSKVPLRVMIDAAQEAGVIFDEIQQDDDNLVLPTELIPLCDKALALGKASRQRQTAPGFSRAEINLLASQYMHCSANWNAIMLNAESQPQGGTAITESVGFPHRPDENWQRTIYNMQGFKQWR
ncbi:MAG: DUF2235 domain-containing protein [Rouxiella aceris]|uniref:phospholipase effector Tle1 domain-containing protein n=1 Tax=Rouxiella aceris TaxID=2703884 RepID=UPI0028498B0D|nr:DUF2235 domain-containing protein [Rouxiella aceris]MDR3433337.1 DUF2235 domain-containing protein [Rouxiella aceris]